MTKNDINLSSLNINDFEYVVTADARDQDEDYPIRLEPKDYQEPDKKWVAQLTSRTGLKHEFAWYAVQRWAADLARYPDTDVNPEQYYAEQLEDFIERSRRFLQVRELIFGNSGDITEAAFAYIEPQHAADNQAYYNRNTIPSEYLKAAYKGIAKFIIFLVVLIVMGNVFNHEWFYIVTVVIIVIGALFIMGIPGRYRSIKEFQDYISHENVYKPAISKRLTEQPEKDFTLALQEVYADRHGARLTSRKWWPYVGFGIGLLLLTEGLFKLHSSITGPVNILEVVMGTSFVATGATSFWAYGSRIISKYTTVRWRKNK